MTAVNFREHRYVTRNPEFTLEETMRRFATFAGIHEFQFDSLYDADEVSWQGDPDISLSGDSVTVEGVSGWDFIYADFLVPASHMVSYTTAAAEHGCVLAYQDEFGDNAGYQVRVSSTAIQIYKVVAGSPSLVFSVPAPADYGNRFDFVFRQYNFSDNKNEVWNFITVYNNDNEIATYGDVYGLSRSEFVIGLMSYSDEVILYDNFRISEFCETAEWGTADPGEYPINGLQRVLEGRYIRFWMRPTGEFRAWKPRSIPLSHAMTGEESYRVVGRATDFASIATHIRMVGAYLWAEHIAAEDVSKYGYRFAEDDNPMLFTETECYVEAVKQYKRRLEGAVTAQVAIQNKPFLEIDDRVAVDDLEYLISSISISVGVGSCIGDLALRKYVWE